MSSRCHASMHWAHLSQNQTICWRVCWRLYSWLYDAYTRGSNKCLFVREKWKRKDFSVKSIKIIMCLLEALMTSFVRLERRMRTKSVTTLDAGNHVWLGKTIEPASLHSSHSMQIRIMTEQCLASHVACEDFINIYKWASWWFILGLN